VIRSFVIFDSYPEFLASKGAILQASALGVQRILGMVKEILYCSNLGPPLPHQDEFAVRSEGEAARRARPLGQRRLANIDVQLAGCPDST